GETHQQNQPASQQRKRAQQLQGEVTPQNEGGTRKCHAPPSSPPEGPLANATAQETAKCDATLSLQSIRDPPSPSRRSAVPAIPSRGPRHVRSRTPFTNFSSAITP